MNKVVSSMSATALLCFGALAGVAPASAGPMHSNFQRQDQHIGNFCRQNPHAGQCDDWRNNHGHWNNDQYQGFYRHHRNDRGFGGDFAARMFGFAIGAAVMVSRDVNAHVRACEVRYRSYDRRSNTFLGYDGSRHLCRFDPCHTDSTGIAPEPTAWPVSALFRLNLSTWTSRESQHTATPDSPVLE